MVALNQEEKIDKPCRGNFIVNSMAIQCKHVSKKKIVETYQNEV